MRDLLIPHDSLLPSCWKLWHNILFYVVKVILFCPALYIMDFLCFTCSSLCPHPSTFNCSFLLHLCIFWLCQACVQSPAISSSTLETQIITHQALSMDFLAARMLEYHHGTPGIFWPRLNSRFPTAWVKQIHNCVPPKSPFFGDCLLIYNNHFGVREINTTC